MEDMLSDDMFFQSNVNQLFGTSSAAQLVAGCILEVDPPAWRQVVALLPRLKSCYHKCICTRGVESNCLLLGKSLKVCCTYIVTDFFPMTEQLFKHQIFRDQKNSPEPISQKMDS